MTISEFILLIGSIGAVSGLIIYFAQRNITNHATSVNIIKTRKETEQLEQEIESKYALQVKRWLDDLHEINEKHESELDKKDDEKEQLHIKYLQAIKDLTENKLSFTQLNKANRRLFINMDVPYWECDSSGKLIYANGAWLSLFGLDSNQALGEGWLHGVLEQDRNALLVAWYSKVVNESDGNLQFNIFNSVTKEHIPVKALFVVMFDAESNVTKIIGTVLRLTS